MTALLKRWRNRFDRRHPSEDRLLEVVVGGADTAAATATARHLRTCARCAQRAGRLRTFLDTIADGADASFEEAFPPDRLRVQRARIGHRLARVVGSVDRARILAFPFRRAPERRRGLRPGRWAVAATAAGLALGMVAGQLVQFHRGPAATPGLGAPLRAAPEAPPETSGSATLDMTGTIELPPPANTAPAPLSLREFEQVMAEAALLDSLDVATVSFPVTELASIDALTPRVPDLAAAAR